MNILIPIVIAGPGLFVDVMNILYGMEWWRKGAGPSSVMLVPIPFYAYASFDYFGFTMQGYEWLALACLWHGFSVFVMHWPAWRWHFSHDDPPPRPPPRPPGET